MSVLEEHQRVEAVDFDGVDVQKVAGVMVSG
jgi:hypothetical protein